MCNSNSCPDIVIKREEMRKCMFINIAVQETPSWIISRNYQNARTWRLRLTGWEEGRKNETVLIVIEPLGLVRKEMDNFYFSCVNEANFCKYVFNISKSFLIILSEFINASVRMVSVYFSNLQFCECIFSLSLGNWQMILPFQ